MLVLTFEYKPPHEAELNNTVSEESRVWIVPASQSRQDDPTGARNTPATLAATSNPKLYYNMNYAASTSAATEMKSPGKYKPNNCLTIN